MKPLKQNKDSRNFMETQDGKQVIAEFFGSIDVASYNAKEVVGIVNMHDELIKGLETSIRLNESLATFLTAGATQDAALETIKELKDQLAKAQSPYQL